MDKRQFRATMVICAGSPTRFHLISTVGDASDFLFDHWASNDSPQWMAAMNKCAWANLGRASIEEANSAFLVAIKAAGMRIDPAITLY